MGFVFQYLDEFEHDDKAAINAFHLMRPQWNIKVRYYAMNVLIRHVQWRWGGSSTAQSRLTPFTAEQKSRMKSSLLAFLMALEPSGDATGVQEFYALQEKACALISTIALHDWPHQWPELMPTLVNDVAARGIAQQQSVLAVWRMIADDMTVRLVIAVLNEIPHRALSKMHVNDT
jgi:hypothetical protein